MKILREWARRIRHLRDRRQFENDLGDELEFHIESRAAELEAAGLPAREAAAQARREFGSRTRLREDARAAWGFRWLEDLAADLAYASRSMRHSPGFAIAAVSCLALGIGANTTIFSLATELLLSQPSLTKPDRLVTFRIAGNSHSEPKVYRFVEEAKPFEEIAGWREAQLNWRNGGETQRVFAMIVTDNLFDMIGIPVRLGRGLRKGDEDVVVLAHSFWQNRLAGEESILGRKLVLNGRPHIVVGVLPPGHRTLTGFGFAPDLYSLYSANREAGNLAFLGRLPEGMTSQQAVSRLQGIGAELDRVQPHDLIRYSRGTMVETLTGPQRIFSRHLLPVAVFLGMLLLVVGLVLLIACANVSSLLLARSITRSAELAVRLALGAGRGRIIRQLLAEALLLALLGTAGGISLSLWAGSFFSRVSLPLPIPLQVHFTPDWQLLLYASVIACVTAVVTGLLPALQATRPDLQAALKQQERQVSARMRLRNALVVCQIAVSVVLLTTAFLFLRNLMHAAQLEVGFDLTHTVYARMDVVVGPQREEARGRLLVDGALDQLRALPGVRSAASAAVVPFIDNITNGTLVRIEGRPDRIPVRLHANFVTPDYFAAMGIPVLKGRDFQPRDRSASPAAAILNDNVARKLFGEADPIGRRFSIPYGDSKEIELIVVGVAKTSKYATIGEDNAFALYRPLSTANSPQIHFVVRMEGDPVAALAPIRQILAQLDTSAGVEVKRLRDSIGFALAPSQIGAALLGAIGLLGLLLASIGLYGVLSYGVTKRTREFGVRIALGASRGGVLRLVLRDTGLTLGLGIGIGIGLALLATQPLTMFLVPELRPSDPLNYIIVALVLGGVGALASAGPALRATRIDPISALRYE